jgi:hypothetical protein
MQQVAVLANGSAWNGKTYPSLSKAAFAIAAALSFCDAALSWPHRAQRLTDRPCRRVEDNKTTQPPNSGALAKING